ncbi:MAG: type II toxin-antitoxin system VapC family toxin [Phycisphaerales bacterium]
MRAKQKATQDWWALRRESFHLVVSDAVTYEIERGDSEAAKKRKSLIASIESLAVDSEVESLADSLARGLGLPERAGLDAFHMAAAARHGIRYLMTWNCKHIANADQFSRIQSLCEQAGFRSPVICTPYELMEAHR